MKKRGAFEGVAAAGGQDGVSTASAGAQATLVDLWSPPPCTQVSSDVPHSGTPPAPALSAVPGSPLAAADDAPSHRLLPWGTPAPGTMAGCPSGTGCREAELCPGKVTATARAVLFATL